MTRNARPLDAATVKARRDRRNAAAIASWVVVVLTIGVGLIVWNPVLPLLTTAAVFGFYSVTGKDATKPQLASVVLLFGIGIPMTALMLFSAAISRVM